MIPDNGIQCQPMVSDLAYNVTMFTPGLFPGDRFEQHA